MAPKHNRLDQDVPEDTVADDKAADDKAADDAPLLVCSHHSFVIHIRFTPGIPQTK